MNPIFTLEARPHWRCSVFRDRHPMEPGDTVQRSSLLTGTWNQGPRATPGPRATHGIRLWVLWFWIPNSFSDLQIWPDIKGYSHFTWKSLKNHGVPRVWIEICRILLRRHRTVPVLQRTAVESKEENWFVVLLMSEIQDWIQTVLIMFNHVHLGVSETRGTPQSSSILYILF